MGVQVGGLDVVTLLAAVAGLPLLGIGGGGGCTSWRIGCGDVAGCRCWVPFAGLPLLGAIAGDRGGGGCTRWRIGCGDVAGCHCWAPLLGIGGGWVYTLAD